MAWCLLEEEAGLNDDDLSYSITVLWFQIALLHTCRHTALSKVMRAIY
jgi:hypothetical protein